MKKVFYILLFVAFVGILPSHAQTCTNTTYGNFTCVHAYGLANPNCPAGTLSITNPVVGDDLYIWTDSDTAHPLGGLTGSGMTTATLVTSLNQAGFVWDGWWHAKITSSTAFGIGVSSNCNGGYEIEAIQVRASSGSISTDCLAVFTYNGGTVNSNTSTCTATHTNDLAISAVDWGNGQPSPSGTAGTLITEGGTEHTMSIGSVATAGSKSTTWSEVGTDSIMSAQLLLTNQTGPAAAFYITRDGAGTKDGSSLANAAACDATANTPQATCAAFNNVSNWGTGSGQIGAGTVVHVGDDSVTITATAGASAYFAFQGSGSSGKNITFLLSTTIQAPYFCCSLGGGAISSNGNSFITIDGTVACGTDNTNSSGPVQPNACVGTIQNTANGDALANQQESTFIFFSNGCSNVEIKNLGLYNQYVKSNTAVSGPSNSADIFCDNNTGNLSVHDNQAHDMQTFLQVVPFSGAQGPWSYVNNDIYNMNWGLMEGAGGSTTVSSIDVHGNHLHDMANWTNASNQYHHDGMYWFGNANTTTFTNVFVYNNVFDGNTTNGACSGCDMTSWWFSDSSDTYTNAYVFNNVVMATSNTPASAGPFLMGFSPGLATGFIFNNTYACNASNGGHTIMSALGADSSSGTVTITAFNNLFSGCATWFTMTSANASFAASGLNNNVYSNCGTTNCWKYHGNFDATLAQWQGHTGQDAAAVSTSGSAGLGGSYENNARSPLAGIIPQSGSIAQSSGKNLTSGICATLSGVNSAAGSACTADITGTPRPTLTTWDVGALQSSGTTSNPSAPATVLLVNNISGELRIH